MKENLMLAYTFTGQIFNFVSVCLIKYSECTIRERRGNQIDNKKIFIFFVDTNVTFGILKLFSITYAKSKISITMIEQNVIYMYAVCVLYV